MEEGEKKVERKGHKWGAGRVEKGAKKKKGQTRRRNTNSDSFSVITPKNSIRFYRVLLSIFVIFRWCKIKLRSGNGGEERVKGV